MMIYMDGIWPPNLFHDDFGWRFATDCCEGKRTYHGNLRYSPQSYPPPPRNKALIRPYEGKPMVDKPLIRPYLLGGVALGGVP